MGSASKQSGGEPVEALTVHSAAEQRQLDDRPAELREVGRAADSSSSRRVRWAFASACRPVTVARSVGQAGRGQTALQLGLGDLADRQASRRPARR